MAEGERIGAFQIERLLGQGAHGVVYKAHAAGTPANMVALKVVEHAGSLDRLLLEPELLTKFRHRNIVGLKDYFLHAGKLVLAMEYIDGTDLDTWLKDRTPLSAGEVREFLRQMAEALAHAHALGVFHSDLKPGNILVESTPAGPRYVIVDFGVSRMIEGIQVRKRMAGTYSFMAPEQLRGRGGKSADLWALGTIAYRMLTGRAPFEGSSLEELTKCVLYHDPVFDPDTVLRVDTDLQRIVMHLLEKNPVQRTESALALLEEVGAGTDSEAHGSSSVAAGSRLPWEERARREIRRRWKWIAVLVTIAFLPDGLLPGAFAIGGAVLISLGSERRHPLLIIGGLLTLIVGLFVGSVIDAVIVAVLELDEASNPLVLFSILFGLFLLPAGVHLVKIRRLQRDLLLLDLIRRGKADETLPLLKRYVDVHVGDLHARVRYVERLLDAGQAAEAVIEALTVLRIDPYNFDAALLLAHAYLELGLVERCQQVCNGYLEVSGHCFEFQDVLERTTISAGRAA